MEIPISARYFIGGWHAALDREAESLARYRKPEGGYDPIPADLLHQRILGLMEMTANMEYFLARLIAQSQGEPDPPLPNTLLGTHLNLPPQGPTSTNPLFPITKASSQLRHQMLGAFQGASGHLVDAAIAAAEGFPRSFGAGTTGWSTESLDAIFARIDEPAGLVPDWAGQPWRRRFLLAYAARVHPTTIGERLKLGEAEMAEFDAAGRTPDEEQSLFQNLADGIMFRMRDM